LAQLVWTCITFCLISACHNDDLPWPGNGKKGPLNVVYVEVNSNNIANAKCYTMLKNGKPFFDIAMIFAANINYDTVAKKAVLYNNPNVERVLTNRNAYIKPLQQKGIKVLLSVLGNHQGAGFANFTSRAAARDFAKQLSNAVKAYDLDGIDFDDEWTEYGKNGLPQPNDSSFIILLQELRKLMPHKLITLYDIGPSAETDSWKGSRIGDYVAFAWNPYYGGYLVPQHEGMSKERLGPAAIWINNTSPARAQALAQRTMDEGYGIVMYYDLKQTDSQQYLSGISAITHKDSVTVTPGCLDSWQ
jgi:hypothetical protein